MALETASYIANLVTTNPDGGDARSTADDHLRLIKAVLKRTFPLMDGAVSLSQTQVSYIGDLSASVQSQFNALRDGPATANFAIQARSASFANAASNALSLGGVAAANYARTDQNVSFSGNIRLINSFPVFRMVETDAPADEKHSGFYPIAGTLRFFLQNDSEGDEHVWLSVDRTGATPSTITFSAGSYVFAGGTITGTISNATNALHAASASFATVAATATTATFANTCTSASSAALLAGAGPDTDNSASSIAKRTAEGNLHASSFHTARSEESISVGHLAGFANLDGYMRVMTIAAVGAHMEARNVSSKTGTTKTLSTSAPSGGSNGDIWYRYS